MVLMKQAEIWEYLAVQYARCVKTPKDGTSQLVGMCGNTTKNKQEGKKWNGTMQNQL